RYLPEVGIVTANRAQPGVFKLARPPDLAQFGTPTWKEFLCFCQHRTWIKQRKRVECRILYPESVAAKGVGFTSAPATTPAPKPMNLRRARIFMIIRPLN